MTKYVHKMCLSRILRQWDRAQWVQGSVSGDTQAHVLTWWCLGQGAQENGEQHAEPPATSERLRETARRVQSGMQGTLSSAIDNARINWRTVRPGAQSAVCLDSSNYPT